MKIYSTHNKAWVEERGAAWVTELMRHVTAKNGDLLICTAKSTAKKWYPWFPTFDKHGGPLIPLEPSISPGDLASSDT